MNMYTFFTVVSHYPACPLDAPAVGRRLVALTLTSVGSVACSLREAGQFENVNGAVVTFLMCLLSCSSSHVSVDDEILEFASVLVLSVADANKFVTMNKSSRR